VQGLAAVAQLDRVLGYEPRGRGFESCQPHQKIIKNNKNANKKAKRAGEKSPALFQFWRQLNQRKYAFRI
jgi:hypothetical protein